MLELVLQLDHYFGTLEKTQSMEIARRNRLIYRLDSMVRGRAAQKLGVSTAAQLIDNLSADLKVDYAARIRWTEAELDLPFVPDRRGNGPENAESHVEEAG